MHTWRVRYYPGCSWPLTNVRGDTCSHAIYGRQCAKTCHGHPDAILNRHYSTHNNGFFEHKNARSCTYPYTCPFVYCLADSQGYPYPYTYFIPAGVI